MHRHAHSVRRLLLPTAVLCAWLLAAPAAQADVPSRPAVFAPPTIPEMQQFVAAHWAYFQDRIVEQDKTDQRPARLVEVPHTLCYLGYRDRHFNCATLVVWELPNGFARSTLVHHWVRREDDGGLGLALVTSLPPPPPPH